MRKLALILFALLVAPYASAQPVITDSLGRLKQLQAQIDVLYATIVTGNLGLAHGGTNTNLSATGGTSFVLRQSTVGANITVSQLAASDLSNGTSGSGAVILATSPTITTATLTNPTMTTPTLGAASATSLNVSALNVSQAVFTDGSKNFVSVAPTGSGLNVLQTSPTLITPTLGDATATSISANCGSACTAITGQSTTFGVVGFSSGASGSAVSGGCFGGSTLCSAIHGGDTGAASSNVAVQGFSSHGVSGQFRAIDPTNTSDTLQVQETQPPNGTQPANTKMVNVVNNAGTSVSSIDKEGDVLGTTFNLVTITKPASTATLTIANGKTFTANNSITLAGTDSTVMTFPTTSATVARTDASNTFTGDQTFSGKINKTTITAPATGSTLTILDGKTLTANNTMTLAGTDATTMTFPTTSATIARTDVGQTFAGTNTFSGAATFSSTINKVTLTAPATGSTLTIADGKTLTVNQTLTLTGTTGTTMTFPATSASVARTDAAQTFTGDNMFSGQMRVHSSSAPSAALHVGAGGTGSNAEELRVDSGSASGGSATISFFRNGVAKGYYGVASAANDIITGSIANDGAVRSAQALLFSANDGATLHARIDSTASGLNLPPLAMTAGTMTVTNSASVKTTTHRFDWTNAMVTALGATTAGDIAVCTLPAKTVVVNAYVVITSAAGTVTTLTVAVGRTSASFIDYIVASDAKAAANTVYGDASGERGTNLTGYDLPSFTGTTVVNAHFISSGGNLSTVSTSTGTIYLTTTTLP